MTTIIPTPLIILGAIPAAAAGLWLIAKAVRRAAHVIVTLEAAGRLILYELVPNDGESLKDKVDRAVQLGEENQRALENHLIDHHQGGRPPEPIRGVPI